MRIACKTALIVLALAVGMPLSAAPGRTPPPAQKALAQEAVAQKPFDGAAIATLVPAADHSPPDVTLLVQVREAAALRRSLQNRPIGTWIASLAGDGEMLHAWKALARDLHQAEGPLFDACFGNSVTLLKRGADEWAIVTAPGAARAAALMKSLRVRARAPRHGLAIGELPEQALLLASDGDRIIIGPAPAAGLLDDVLARLDAQGDGAALPTLRKAEDFNREAQAAGLPGERPHIIAFVRHSAPLGGCSLIRAHFAGDEVRLSHTANFEHAPFLSPVTRTTCDFSPVMAFAESALCAIMQPNDVGDGPVETFLQASLGAGFISPDLRTQLAERRLLVVGEEDGRQLPGPGDLLTTTFVAGVEVEDATRAAPILDEQMRTLTRRLNNLGKGAYLIRVPDTTGLSHAQARHVDLGCAEELFTGGFPIMKTVSLNWTVAESDSGRWCLVGSSPRALQDAVKALNAETGLPAKRAAPLNGRFDNCGFANGVRIGRHFDDWSDGAEDFTDAENVLQVRSALKSLAQLAAGVQTCCWQLARPTAESMRLDVQITLAPAESSRPVQPR